MSLISRIRALQLKHQLTIWRKGEEIYEILRTGYFKTLQHRTNLSEQEEIWQFLFRLANFEIQNQRIDRKQNEEGGRNLQPRRHRRQSHTWRSYPPWLNPERYLFCRSNEYLLCSMRNWSYIYRATRLLIGPMKLKGWISIRRGSSFALIVTDFKALSL